jgi:hypothetical protein
MIAPKTYKHTQPEYTEAYVAELNQKSWFSLTQAERDKRALDSFAAECAKYGSD